MARSAVCECLGQMALDDDTPWDPRRCNECGARTSPGKWRCDECQARGVERAAARRAGVEAMRAARRAESARVHDDAAPPA